MENEESPKNLGEVLRDGAALLEAQGLSSARLDAELLLARALGRDRAFLLRERDRAAGPGILKTYWKLIGRRQAGEPVAYLLGEKEFWSLDFFVDHRVLIPRPETEILMEEVLHRFSGLSLEPLYFLDVGTGSGILAVVLARVFPLSRVAASDISRDALRVAAINAKRHGVTDRVSFLLGDMLHPVKGPFDGIVSNPPYIEAAVYGSIERDVRDFEPPGALLAGEEGMAYHKMLIDRGGDCLKPGGWLFMEMGEEQGTRIRSLFDRSGGYESVFIRRDYSGRDRVIAARRRR